MKSKAFFIVLTFIAISYIFQIFTMVFNDIKAVSVSQGEIEERYNDELSREVASRIGQIDGVLTAAVVKRDKTVLIGVNLEEGKGERTKIKNTIKSIADEYFGNFDNIIVELQTGEANDIIELSYYLDTGIPNTILNKRFNFLEKSLKN